MKTGNLPAIRTLRRPRPPGWGVRVKAALAAWLLWQGAPAAPVVAFDSPEDAGAVLPNLEDLLPRLIERAATEPQRQQQFESAYAYVAVKITERRDAANRLRQREVEREEHDPLGPAADRKERGPGYRRKDFQTGGELFDRYRMEIIGAEEIDGRPAWILTFEPVDPPAPARNLKERFLNQIAGRAWIDQNDTALARLELHLTGPVNVVGGLVGAVKGCRVLLERARTPEGLWFDRHLAWRLEGRRLFATNVMLREETKENLRRVGGVGNAGQEPCSCAPTDAGQEDNP